MPSRRGERNPTVWLSSTIAWYRAYKDLVGSTSRWPLGQDVAAIAPPVIIDPWLQSQGVPGTQFLLPARSSSHHQPRWSSVRVSISQCAAYHGSYHAPTPLG